jgi:hypothetical protein
MTGLISSPSASCTANQTTKRRLLLALVGPRVISDLSPQSGPNRTLIRLLSPIAILWVHALIETTKPALDIGAESAE